MSNESMRHTACVFSRRLDAYWDDHVTPDERAVIESHLPTCPASLARLVQRAMAKDPGLRPSAVEMAAALHAEAVASRSDDSHLLAGGGSTVVARPVELADGSTIGMAPVGPSGRSAAVRWLLGLVCLVALGFGAWGTWHLMVGRFGRQG